MDNLLTLTLDLKGLSKLTSLTKLYIQSVSSSTCAKPYIKLGKGLGKSPPSLTLLETLPEMARPRNFLLFWRLRAFCYNPSS